MRTMVSFKKGAYGELPVVDTWCTQRLRVLVSIPTGFQLRQFVHSGVLDLLLESGCEALIVSPNRPGEGFSSQLPADGVEVYPLQVQFGRLLNRYWRARQHLYLKSQTETLKGKHGDLRRRLPGVAIGTRLGRTLFRWLPKSRELALSCERFVLQNRVVESLLDTHPADIVLLGSPGYLPQDSLLLHAAVARDIPVMVAISSWDNLSSKGFINPQPDRLFVWSDHMRREAIELHGIPEDRIVETGASLYDVFANAKRFGSRTENLTHLGMDWRRRVIFYGTNHRAHFPDEIEVVKQVAKWVEEDALGVPCQLWVRLHPQAVAGPYKVSVGPYSELASERVKIEFPPVRDSNLLWDLPRNDIEHLVRLLRDADVVINTASTLAIDAAVLDRPVVSVAYDPAGDLPYERSVRRYYDYTHMAHVVRAGAVRLARSPDDLRRTIIAYLEEPALDREGRARIVEQQFGRVDGNSAFRIAEQVISFALKDKATLNGSAVSSEA